MSLDIDKELTNLCNRVNQLVTEAERELKKIGVSLEDTEQNTDKESDRE